ncbi:site-specific integrase [Sphingomonas sp.]|uniref:tyrosine-type recombinase/integrase n=1 Tax=Sphingomonas sp. TaxID=28214 RepID=UPI001B0DA168|nr:site-specific integrase [Sphingomonas sp.]MBO9714264.1 integrase arm-type DNA-binding domain-containing protein [Sphingomonas sp.]
MKYNVLTQLKAKNAPEGSYGDGQGLWLVKSERARGKWVLRVFVSGRRREMGLGRWPDVSIAEAREKAAEARKLSRGLEDPIEVRRKAKRGVRRLTVKEAIEGCFEARKAELKGDGKAGRWMSPLETHVIPKIGTHAIEDLDQHVLRDLLAPLWHEKPEAAAKALNRVNLAVKHAAALGLSVDMQACMKARALLGKQRHTTEHIPSLPYADAPAFYKWLLTVEGVSALALRFLILTCARTSEVRLATFDEIDGAIWTLPAERTKTGIERRVPLVGEALAVAEECRKKSKHHLFPAYKGQPLSDAAMATLMKRQGYDARPHGFRSTFRTWCEEQTDAAFAVKEAVLGHVVDTGVVGAYQRSDRLEKRRNLLENWQNFLLDV